VLRFACAAVVSAVVAVAASGCGTAGSGADDTALAASGAGAQVANGPSASGRAPVPEGPRRASRAAVPILMYHVIAPAPAGAKYAGLWVSPAALRAQVAALARAGYTAVTLDQVLDAWDGKPTLPPKPVVLTFDDGYLSQGQDAGAILAERGWPGVLYLAWHNLGTPGGLSSTRVRQMVRDGWEVDAHSLTHPDLTTLDAAALRHEVAGSRARIRAAFGVPADGFCYPAGRFDPAVEDAVREAGYRSATSELPGRASPAQDRFALSRIRVDASDTAATVLARVGAR
jgi:peptidoglycan/xylan/chitin deacetylase (PgdA/CDA1 family)